MDILPDTPKFWSVSSDKKVTYQQRKSPEYVNFIATNQNSPNTQNILALLYQDPCNSDANWDRSRKALRNHWNNLKLHLTSESRTRKWKCINLLPRGCEYCRKFIRRKIPQQGENPTTRGKQSLEPKPFRFALANVLINQDKPNYLHNRNFLKCF